MKKALSPSCLLCADNITVGSPDEDISHFILSCPALDTVRQSFLCQFVTQCPQLILYLEPNQTLLLILLDPCSKRIPSEIRENWLNINEAYSISRNFAHAMHRKRENLIREKEKFLLSLDDEIDESDNSVSNIIIRLYQK